MPAPLHIVVMGVTGTGKSTVGQALARRLGWAFIEGDALHPPANIATLAAGVALTDADRSPWLAAVAAAIAEHDGRGASTVVACSALRRSYRDGLRAAVADREPYFVHLTGTPDVLAARMRDRSHFMPPSLLPSQVRTLEPLEPNEVGVVVDVSEPLDIVVRTVQAAVEAHGAGKMTGGSFHGERR